MAAVRDDGGAAARENWPEVTAVIPARDEADGVGETVGSLLRQDYPGTSPSCWSTTRAPTAPPTWRGAPRRRLAAADRLTVLSGAALPAGWTGKLWAMKQGIDHAAAGAPTYLLLTDADIVYEPDALSRLVAKAQSRRPRAHLADGRSCAARASPSAR